MSPQSVKLGKGLLKAIYGSFITVAKLWQARRSGHPGDRIRRGNSLWLLVGITVIPVKSGIRA